MDWARVFKLVADGLDVVQACSEVAAELRGLDRRGFMDMTDPGWYVRLSQAAYGQGEEAKIARKILRAAYPESENKPWLWPLWRWLYGGG